MTKKIVAISSGGGHWEQLQLISPAFHLHDVHYITTLEGLAESAGVRSYEIVSDCNRGSVASLVRCTIQIFKALKRSKPDLVVSTGAAPGLIALFVGKYLLGAKAVWIDSVANAEQLSMSGKLAQYVADVRLTQWKHLSNGNDVEYLGSVL